jgi:FKBP-type peptidyl-prolyl cis-trans isomerase
MSEVTAVPLRPIKKGALVILWAGLALIALTGVAVAFKGTEKQAAVARFLARNAKNPGVVTTTSGLQYKVLEKGTGAKPTLSDIVLADYVGMLDDGKVFDSTVGGRPAVLPVDRVVPGFSQGLQLMSPGAYYRFWIPPQLGYGAGGQGEAIPPNSVLIFDVHLLAVQPQQPGMGGISAPNGG